MFRDATSATPRPSTLLLIALMALAAAPPVALLLMQREARRLTPYLTIELSGEPGIIRALPEAGGS